jgi:hypothetical protein
MALFVDGPACTIDDLVDEDSGLLDVAHTIGINVATKLRLAMGELRSEIETWLTRPQAVTGPLWVQAPRIGQVVVTPEMARWEKMQALALVYQDAYFNQLIDRYQAKWDEYTKLARFARNQFVANGVGLVTDPVPKASMPVLGTVTAAPQQTGGFFYACVAWINAGGQEGAASDAASVTISPGNLMTVAAVDAPVNAVGFNVYAGTVLAALQRQNDVALPTGGTYLYVPGMVTGGQAAGAGQTPDYTKRLVRTMLRG